MVSTRSGVTRGRGVFARIRRPEVDVILAWEASPEVEERYVSMFRQGRLQVFAKAPGK